MRLLKTLAAMVLLTLASGTTMVMSQGQSPAEEPPPKLLGQVTTQQLGEEPFSEWYQQSYVEYQPNPEILERLRQVDTEGLEIAAFFGTWCGDSRREIPRLTKTLDMMGFPAGRVTLVAVDNDEAAVKQSPDGEHEGVEIYRVPVIVISREGRELARFVEHAALSMERDLLAMLTGDSYVPSYIAYPTVRLWLRNGLLSDANISPSGLADQVRPEVTGPGDLSAAGRVLLSRGDITEAVQLYRVNCDLFPREASAFAGLAGALQAQGEMEEARAMAERALRLNEDPALLQDLVTLIDGTRTPAATED